MNRPIDKWWDVSWNPVTGCKFISMGCEHCYARTIAHRFEGTKAFPRGFQITYHEERLSKPVSWRRPRVVFVDSMGDLFHHEVDLSFIYRVFYAMSRSPENFFLIVTKRAVAMAEILSDPRTPARVGINPTRWPLPNVGLGVTVEHQSYSYRIRELLRTPAAMRFVSLEPLLGPIMDLHRYLPSPITGKSEMGPGLDWVICGAETGPQKRTMQGDWAWWAYLDAKRARIPFFFKRTSEGSTFPWGPEREGWRYHEYPYLVKRVMEAGNGRS